MDLTLAFELLRSGAIIHRYCRCAHDLPYAARSQCFLANNVSNSVSTRMRVSHLPQRYHPAELWPRVCVNSVCPCSILHWRERARLLSLVKGRSQACVYLQTAVAASAICDVTTTMGARAVGLCAMPFFVQLLFFCCYGAARFLFCVLCTYYYSLSPLPFVHLLCSFGPPLSCSTCTVAHVPALPASPVCMVYFAQLSAFLIALLMYDTAALQIIELNRYISVTYSINHSSVGEDRLS